ncbi:MAG: type II secretion system protein GspD [Candidatus Omnitrophica bacterium]|nr:type II secretion system protein GspD [Candidatus Omnitrophota bacterium]
MFRLNIMLDLKTLKIILIVSMVGWALTSPVVSSAVEPDPVANVAPNAAAAQTPGAVNHSLIDVLDFKQIDIADVLRLISLKVQRNIVASQNVKGRITVYLKDISVLDALRVIVDAYGWAFIEEGDIIKVMTAQEYEERLGEKFGRPLTSRIYNLHYGNTATVSAMLNQIKSPQGKVLGDEKSNTMVLMDTPAKLTEMDEIIKRLDVQTETAVFDLSYATAKDVSAQITPMLTSSLGVIKTDDRSNRLIVTDTARVLEQVRNLIKTFDSRHKEVLIQAKIVQVVLDDEHKMGVDWEAVVSKFKKLTFKSDFTVLADSDKRGKVSIGTLSDDDFAFMLEALNTVGDTNILSSPRITALNNEEAKILVGSTEPYVTSTTTTTASGPATTAESVNFIDVGVKLYVTPTIHNDGFITIKIKPEVSSATGKITTSNNNTIPIIETSEAQTKVMVKNGVTIVLGGLIKEETVKTEKSVPLLGKLPLLGVAFRSENHLVRKTEIAIFIKPTIISGDTPVQEHQQISALPVPEPITTK